MILPVTDRALQIRSIKRWPEEELWSGSYTATDGRIWRSDRCMVKQARCRIIVMLSVAMYEWSRVLHPGETNHRRWAAAGRVGQWGACTTDEAVSFSREWWPSWVVVATLEDTISEVIKIGIIKLFLSSSSPAISETSTAPPSAPTWVSFQAEFANICWDLGTLPLSPRTRYGLTLIS